MKKMYFIQWKSKVNGRAGKGTKQFTREEGEKLVEELNREYPQIDHELMEASSHAESGKESSKMDPALELAGAH